MENTYEQVSDPSLELNKESAKRIHQRIDDVEKNVNDVVKTLIKHGLLIDQNAEDIRYIKEAIESMSDLPEKIAHQVSESVGHKVSEESLKTRNTMLIAFIILIFLGVVSIVAFVSSKL